jgi:hypothetical protein
MSHFLSFLASPVHNDAGDAIAQPIRGGHLDEAVAIALGAVEPDAPAWDDGISAADLAELAALDADQTLSNADEYIRSELAKVRAAAHAAIGNVRVRVDRAVILDGTGEFRVQWLVSIADVAAGIGADGDEALADALRCVDVAKAVTAIATGGYRVTGVAAVLGAPYRSNDEALKHARRIAVNVQYLDAALVWQCPGIADLRQPSPSNAAVA